MILELVMRLVLLGELESSATHLIIDSYAANLSIYIITHCKFNKTSIDSAASSKSSPRHSLPGPNTM